MESYPMWIDGAPAPSISGETLAIYDPSTEEEIGRLASGDGRDVELAVAAARRCFEKDWSRLKPKERGRKLAQLARELEARVALFSELESLDSGKPLALARKEVLSTARYFEYYAGAADKLHGESIPLGRDYLDLTIREPLGVTAHIVPWNMPLNMIGRSVAPALACGNTAVIKPSEFTSLSALALGKLFAELDFPPGIYNVVTGYGDRCGAALVEHEGIDGITFTGSPATGRRIMRAAATHIRPLVLELGGKSPHLVFSDADQEFAAGEVVRGITMNSGQICSAGSRLLVEKKCRKELLERVIAKLTALRVGPGRENPEMGPLVSCEHRQRVLGYLERGLSAGARVLCGGGPPKELARGYFIAPTLFDGVNPNMELAREEIFGPVLVVMDFEGEEEAVSLANHTPYGLVAGLHTKDLDRALRLATEIRAGQIYVNEYYAGGEETPFGGFGLSGFGREKGLAALSNYTQLKNIAIRIRR